MAHKYKNHEINQPFFAEKSTNHVTNRWIFTKFATDKTPKNLYYDDYQYWLK